MKHTLILSGFLILFGLNVRAETNEEMIKRVGLDPSVFSQGELDPGKLPDLRLWLKGDTGIDSDADGRVRKWSDSDRGVILEQGNAQSRPTLVKSALNGRGAIQFSGNPVTLEAKEFAPGGNSLSVVMVVRVTKDSYFGGFLSYGTPDHSYAPPFRFSQFSNNGKLLLGDGPAERGSILPGSGFKILQADYDATAHRFSVYENGGLVGSTSATGELPDIGPLVLGNNLIGEIAEVLVFNSLLNTSTRAALSAQLMKKYGLSPDKRVSSLAPLLPFAYYPSSSEIEVAFDSASPLLREYFDPVPSQPVSPAGTVAGLGYAYYTSLPALNALPDFAKLTPEKTGTTAGLSLAPTSDGITFVGDHKKPNAVIFKGYLEVPQAGAYTFFLREYGVAQLFVDDRLIVNQLSGQYGPNWKQKGGVIALKAGKYPITLAAKILNNAPELPKDLVTFSVDGSKPAAIPGAWFSHEASQAWNLPVPSPAGVTQRLKALDSLKEIGVRVTALKDGKPVRTFSLPLDAGGRGQARFKLPELADGEYAVDYLVGGKSVRATQTFTRRHFPFEKNDLGLEHKVYPPFVPVKVKGDEVSVVDRSYKLNALGLFNSVVSKGKELLANSMKLVVEDASGKRIEWEPGEVAGEVKFPDLAEFKGSAKSALGSLKSSVFIEEDGCAKINWQIDPAKTAPEISRMYLEIELPDAMAPLFHYTGNNSMRLNYAGKTPRGGKIIWDLEGPGWVPAAWKAEPGPADGVIWDSTQIAHFGKERDNFCPYIWLGAEERGLAWFAGTDHGYVNDGREPVQTVSRERDKVVMRIYFIQQPTKLDKPLSYTFGLQASPTKPLRDDWRAHKVPGGGGCIVNVWGGYICSDKYPDGADFTIVDKIQEARKTGVIDEEYFKKKDKNRAWSDMKIQFDAPWLEYALLFARFGTDDFKQKTPGAKSVTYFEEHATDARLPEWQVFQDEWSAFGFNRFEEHGGNYSQAARSYRDFALYFANEWMKRGVSLYFDNTMHRIVSNPYNQDYIGRTFTIWDQRDYYKRIWKDMARLNTTKETPYELDFTGHVTNTQTIPENTWFTATLDLEQDYRVDKTRKPPEWMAQHDVYRLPFPPDYTRTMTIGRTVGVTPYIMSMLSNFGSDFRDRDYVEKLPAIQWRSECGMRLVHEIGRGGVMSPADPPTWNVDFRGRRLIEYLAWFGYGQPGVTVHNYWEDKPFVSVSDSEVTWLAMTRKTAPAGLLLLQSYKPDPVTVTVRFPDGLAMMDLFSRELFTADAGGAVTIPMAGIYGTRVLAVAKNREELPPPSSGRDIVCDDFELGLSSALFLKHLNMAIVADDSQPGNHVLRITTGHPAHEVMAQMPPATVASGDASLALRFRLAKIPEKSGGVLSVSYRSVGEYPKNNSYELRLKVDRRDDGTAVWVVEQVRAIRDGKEETFSDIATNLVGQPLPSIPVDTNWHRVTIEMRGSRQVIRVDDLVVFEGTSDASLAGGLIIGPGWGMDPSLPYVEIDDLKFQKL